MVGLAPQCARADQAEAERGVFFERSSEGADSVFEAFLFHKPTSHKDDGLTVVAFDPRRRFRVHAQPVSRGPLLWRAVDVGEPAEPLRAREPDIGRAADPPTCGRVTQFHRDNTRHRSAVATAPAHHSPEQT